MKTKDYGLRWLEFSRKTGRLTTWERWFETAAKRSVFLERIIGSADFHELEALIDPTGQVVIGAQQ